MPLGLVFNRNRQVPAEDSPAFGAIAERFRRAGASDRAVSLCQQGLEKFPDHLSARVTLGWALLALGRHDEARAELEIVRKKAPDNLAALRGLAELHGRGEAHEHAEDSDLKEPWLQAGPDDDDLPEQRAFPPPMTVTLPAPVPQEPSPSAIAVPMAPLAMVAPPPLQFAIEDVVAAADFELEPQTMIDPRAEMFAPTVMELDEDVAMFATVVPQAEEMQREWTPADRGLGARLETWLSRVQMRRTELMSQ